MKRITSLYIFLLVGLVFTSCEDKLNQTPEQDLSVDQALADLDGMETALIGAYDELQDLDYYGREYIVTAEIHANLVYLTVANSNRFVVDYTYQYNPTSGEMLNFFTDSYQAILRVNNIIERIDGLEGDQARKDAIKGQALAIRGLVYFDLLRYFSTPYTQGNPASDLGVAYVTQFEIDLPTRNTVQECYTQLIADLNQARSLVTDQGIHRIGPDAVDALLARVYLYQGDWGNAASKANAVIGTGSYTLTDDFVGMFAAPGSSEEIFTLQFVSAENRGSDNLGSIYNSSSYGDVRVTTDIIDLYEPDDQRLGVIRDEGGEFFQTKYFEQDGIPGLHSPKLFRIAEMYLIAAEAALNGAGGDATALLNEIRAARGATALGGATFDDLYAERQRELAFEGHTSFDYWRTGRTMVRQQCNTGLEVNAPCSIEASDFKTVYPIPQVERDANPNFAQNPNWE